MKHELAYTESFEMHSHHLGEKFQISVALPKTYNNQKKYPVVYLTDANVFFGIVSETSWLLQFGKEIPEVIIAGIGYCDPRDHLNLRYRDLTPTKTGEKKQEGGAGQFLNFIVEELKPHINEKYHTDPSDSTLAGDSFGGLFSLYAMFHRTEEFNRYIAGSPSLYWDDGILFKKEEDYFQRRKDLPVRLFLSAGELEAIKEPQHAAMLSNSAKMTEILHSRYYEGFSMYSHIFNGESHLSVIPATFSRGLREVFRSPL